MGIFVLIYLYANTRQIGLANMSNLLLLLAETVVMKCHGRFGNQRLLEQPGMKNMSSVMIQLR
jgi:hypothetical protein